MEMEGFKVAVGMQQRQIVFDAKGGDEYVDSLSYRYAFLPQKTKIICAFFLIK